MESATVVLYGRMAGEPVAGDGRGGPRRRGGTMQVGVAEHDVAGERIGATTVAVQVQAEGGAADELSMCRGGDWRAVVGRRGVEWEPEGGGIRLHVRADRVVGPARGAPDEWGGGADPTEPMEEPERQGRAETPGEARMRRRRERRAARAGGGGREGDGA